MDIFTLEELGATVELFSLTQCDFLTENCIVALESNKHSSNCNLEILGETETQFSIRWSKVFNKAGYKESKKIIEHAAEAISFFLSNRFTEYKVIEEATIGTGVDYWLGYSTDHALYNAKNFMQARLEISGINKETRTNTLMKRVEQKKLQTNQSSSTNLPAYISVVEFKTPKAFFCKK